MENNVTFIPVIVNSDTFIPKSEKENKNELSYPKMNKLERVDDNDNFVGMSSLSMPDCYQMKAFKLPSTSEIIKGMAVIPVVLETGKQILIGIFDLYDVWNARPGKDEHKAAATILPDEIANTVLNQEA